MRRLYKNFSIAALCAMLLSTAKSQDYRLYGVASGGSTINTAVIFEFIPSSGIYTVKHAFDNTDFGAGPESGLIMASNNKMYGMARYGGENGMGTIYEYDPSTEIFTKLIDFADSNGKEPAGAFFQADNGKLYGTTTEGGFHGDGVLFEYDIQSKTQTILVNFLGGPNATSIGADPYGSVIQAFDGNLYGMTRAGGDAGRGVIYKYDLDSAVYSVLYNFPPFPGAGNPGARPYGDLLEIDSVFYGLTSGGGNPGNGIIFSFNPTTLEATKHFEWTTNQQNGFEPDGQEPRGSFCLANNGLLYATTLYGGATQGSGTIFSFDKDSNVFNLEHSFDITNGSQSYATLMQSQNGKLYGYTSLGGANQRGCIFDFDPATSTQSVVVSFNDSDQFGKNPLYGKMIEVDFSTLGTKELSRGSENKLLAYPNPSNGTFIIQSSIQDDYIILNQVGAVVAQGKLMAGQNTLKLDKLSKGCYFIKTSKSDSTTKLILTL